MRFDGFMAEIKSLHVNTRRWRCFHCGNKWGQSFDNEYLCGSCSVTQILAFAHSVSSPRIVVGKITMETKKRTHFDSLNQSVEIPITIKNLERAGKLNTKEKVDWAKDMIEDSKWAKKIDYQRHGHPSFDNDFKHPDFERIE